MTASWEPGQAGRQRRWRETKRGQTELEMCNPKFVILMTRVKRSNKGSRDFGTFEETHLGGEKSQGGRQSALACCRVVTSPRRLFP